MKLSLNFVDVLIPKELKQEEDLLFKIRLFVLILLVCFITVTIPVIISLLGIKQFHPHLGIEYLNVTLPFCVLWIAKNHFPAINLLFLSSIVVTIHSVLITGGISSPIIIWMCLIPIFALYFLGIESALYWMVFLIFMIVIIFQFDSLGLTLVSGTIEYSNSDHLYNIIAFIVFLTLGIYLFWSAQKRLIEKIQSQKQALEEKNHLLEKKTNELNMARQSLVNYNDTLALQNDKLSKAKEKLVQSNLLLEKQNHSLTTTKSALIDSNEALNRYAHTVSHDLKEPLRSISSFSNILYEYYDKQGLVDSARSDFFNFVLDGTKNMNRLIREMLQFSEISKEGESNFKNIDLNQVVQIAQNNLNKQIKETGTEINVEPLPEIFGLFIPMTQIFQNLITNAIKFRKKDAESCINIRVEAQANKWIISVEDNGIGIAKENQQKVFQEFEKLHEKTDYKGQGIGLSTCKKFVQKHGGRIWLQSTPNEGTTFYFSIPKKKEVAMADPNHSSLKQKQEVVL